MAQYCPKCNYKLRLTDWRPECPKCGVNVVYYGIDERLEHEADEAEHHHALSQPKYDRLKFSLIGHKLSIVRLVLGLLPIAALLLPMGTVSYALPYVTEAKPVNLISIINIAGELNLDLGFISGLVGSKLVGTGVIFFLIALLGVVAVAVISLVGWVLLTLSCSPRGKKRNIRLPIVGIVFATVAFVSYVLMINRLQSALPTVFTGTVNPLAYIAVVLLFVAMIVVNVVYFKKDIPVKYKDVSELLIPYAERASTIAADKAAADANAAQQAADVSAAAE